MLPLAVHLTNAGCIGSKLDDTSFILWETSVSWYRWFPQHTLEMQEPFTCVVFVSHWGTRSIPGSSQKAAECWWVAGSGGFCFYLNDGEVVLFSLVLACASLRGFVYFLQFLFLIGTFVFRCFVVEQAATYWSLHFLPFIFYLNILKRKTKALSLDKVLCHATCLIATQSRQYAKACYCFLRWLCNAQRSWRAEAWPQKLWSSGVCSGNSEDGRAHTWVRVSFESLQAYHYINVMVVFPCDSGVCMDHSLC